MAIVINGSGTVTGLAVGGLPDGTVDAGTLATDSVTAAKLEASAITSADLPAGSVLQVVSATYAVEVSTTGGSYIDTGLTAAITPTSTSSKILVFVSQNGVSKGAGNGGVYGQFLRGSTVLKVLAPNVGYTANSEWNRIGVGWSSSYLDSPATTSATTYKTQFRAFNSVIAYVQKDEALSTITLMEIAG